MAQRSIDLLFRAARLAVLGWILGHLGTAHAISGGAQAPAAQYRFVVHIEAGGQGCSGVLIARRWVLTASSCFAAGGQRPVAGPPPAPASVHIAAGGAGAGERRIAIRELVPHADRNLVLAKLQTLVNDVPPAVLSATGAADGEPLIIAGYGRTHSQWVPDALHAATASVVRTAGGGFALAGSDGSAVSTCKGDSGGPALRSVAGRVELVGIHHSSAHAGCFAGGAAGAGPSTETRVDDLEEWIASHTRERQLQDFNGDGLADLATLTPNGGGGWRETIALELSTGSGFTSVTWPAVTPLHMRNGGGTAFDYRVMPGDYNGDGLTDLATITPTGGGAWRDWVALELSTGTAFNSVVWPAATPLHMRNGAGTAWDYHVLNGDFDGDGLTDLATISATGGGAWRDWVALELSTGTGFNSVVWPATTPTNMRNGGGNTWAYRVVPGDFNGDGLTDLATLTATGGGGWRDSVALELSTGTGFNSVVWPATTPMHMHNGGGSTWDYRVFPGDFNGDGLTDLATITALGAGGWSDWVAVELSTGTGFRSELWPAATPIHMRNGGAHANYKVMTGDFNGDGLTDLATVTANGGGGWRDWVALELSTGTGFTSVVWPAATPMHMRNGGPDSDYRVAAEDFDGDGMTDLATLTRNGGGGWLDMAALERSTGNAFTSEIWKAATPVYMRLGGADSEYLVLPGM